MTSSTDGNGQKTVYRYDPLGRMTFTEYKQDSSGGFQSTLTYAYDSSTGNLHSVTDSTAGAGSITYTYDAFDHVTAETAPAAQSATPTTPPGSSPP